MASVVLKRALLVARQRSGVPAVSARAVRGRQAGGAVRIPGSIHSGPEAGKNYTPGTASNVNSMHLLGFGNVSTTETSANQTYRGLGEALAIRLLPSTSSKT